LEKHHYFNPSGLEAKVVKEVCMEDTNKYKHTEHNMHA
jgi:hypothetical protein